MKVKDHLSDDVVTIALGGKIMPGEDLTSFQGKVHYYLGLNKTRFVIDLQQVEWMSSAGLGALIAAHTSVLKANGKLVLANVTNVRSLLNLTQLVRVFEIHDSNSEAESAVRN